jgi:hypothetical protein
LEEMPQLSYAVANLELSLGVLSNWSRLKNRKNQASVSTAVNQPIVVISRYIDQTAPLLVARGALRQA